MTLGHSLYITLPHLYITLAQLTLAARVFAKLQASSACNVSQAYNCQ